MIAIFPRHRHDLGGRIDKSLRRAILLVGVLAVVVAGLLCAGHRWFLTSTERKLVGSWAQAGSPVTTRVFIFGSDRRVTSRIVDRSGATVGEVLGDQDETWFVDGQTIFIRRGRKGSFSLLEVITGPDFLWDHWPIVSLTDNTLVIGDESWGQHFVLKRKNER